MSTMILEAETRADKGKGASRRLRRLENKVPAVLYGGDKEPEAIHLLHNKVVKALETESIYSSVFDLKLDGKVQRVILKDLQRHPYKPIVMHMDLQRVSDKDILIKMIPLHFINEQDAKGVKAGGMINHSMMQVEVKCQAKDLPEFIEVDVKNLGLNDVLHLSDLKLPKGVELAHEIDAEHDHPVVSIHAQKAGATEETAGESVSETPDSGAAASAENEE
ncbi:MULTISPECIES: 50S ribosomal protein L25/general stress protein Ctc [Legionella]|uniref:Large ribosomal subunit protein bL25 n=1 Tax=Legionella septentrionalis TaxID=2498109 RepID=A0A433JN34_9GAMM|nr:MULTISPECIES: 50S ribosomal protein L25/general stress protein Ctc [Legionella]MCP0913060.1 50S ribosomal protein L25/general stress protein Ctc [Legionella sp. 27cVA30]RUQ91513.1 50S ribosomal protein L25/general stress protein Ctc [Legionella septentrionalis]RUQ98484.1 50S ribosomal protein L25/general stress protein Ctc [Legionella septentrionalis]RUR10868.1 50S ribosomal protein L25/general stress protein Ctc [Legionella septentrionalis]RUR14599.1 50S ribosomal protein L25/general stres